MSTTNTIKRITVDLTSPKKAHEDDADTGMDADHGPMHSATHGAVQAKVLKKRGGKTSMQSNSTTHNAEIKRIQSPRRKKRVP